MEPVFAFDSWHRAAVAGLDARTHFSWSGLEILNYFGLGNDTPGDQSSTFYKVEQRQVEVSTGLEWRIVKAPLSRRSQAEEDNVPTPAIAGEPVNDPVSLHLAPILKFSNTPVEANADRFIAQDPALYGVGAFGEVGLRGGLTIDIPRGVVVVTARVNGRQYRVANTHLEPASIPELLPLQLAQAQELLGILDGGELPVILMGDLNSHAPLGDTYQLIAADGYGDAWLERRGIPSEGFTCCHAVDLLNPVPDFDRRIDLVLYKRFTPKLIRATVIGDEFINRTENGAWPSDHGGVVAYLRQ